MNDILEVGTRLFYRQVELAEVLFSSAILILGDFDLRDKMLRHCKSSKHMKAHLYTRQLRQSDSAAAAIQRDMQEFDALCESMSYIPGEAFVEYGSGDLPLTERPVLSKAVEAIKAGEILYASRRNRLSSKNSVVEEIKNACESKGIELRERSSVFRAVRAEKLIQQMASDIGKEPAFVVDLLDKFIRDLACGITLGPVTIAGLGTLERNESKVDHNQPTSSVDILFTPSETILDQAQKVSAVIPWSSMSDEYYEVLVPCLQTIKEHLCNRQSVKVAGLGTFEIYQILGSAEVDPITNATLSMIPTRRLARLNIHRDFVNLAFAICP